MSKIAFVTTIVCLTVVSNAAQSKKLDTAQIDELTGIKGNLNGSAVLRIMQANP